VLEIIHGRRLTVSLIGPPLLDDSVVDDRTRHHAPECANGWLVDGCRRDTTSPWLALRTAFSGAIPIWLTR